MTETSTLTPQSAEPGQHRGLWPIRIVTLVLALVVLAACSASVVGLFFVREHTETTTFTEPVHEVRVSTDTGDVVIRAAAAGEETTVVSKGRSAFRKAEHSAGVKDGVLMVSGACRGSFIIADSCSMDFEIVVPAGSAVQANSNTGNLSIAGPSSSVLASTDTGDIRVLRVGGSIRLRTSTGDVTGDELKSLAASAQTDTGDVALGFSTAPHQLRAVADTGDVQIRVPDDGSVYQVQASTDTGDRFVSVPTAPTAERSIDAETSTGDVRIVAVRVP
jgi:Putative adhesin